MLKCKTNREHFEKFCFIRAKTGVSFLNTDLFGTKEELTKLFLEDPTLNQISPDRFEYYHDRYKALWVGITLEETGHLIKHSLIYQVIGATPEFTDEE
jgi:hypothetical protein